MDAIKIIIALLIIAGNAFTGSHRVHYNVRGSISPYRRNPPPRRAARSWI